MNRTAAFVLAIVLGALTLWLQRESARGTFDAVERVFLSWLAANVGSRTALPPLTLVLFDDEARELAGARGLEMLDGALFARAAWRLGAVGAGVEGLSGDPRRMIDAAGGLPVFGGYDWSDPPNTGWTPLRGQPGEGWSEVPGLIGRPGRWARGFLAVPGGMGGSREIVLAGQNTDRPVVSFLVLGWIVAQQWRWSEVAVAPDGFRGPDGWLPVNAAGRSRFFPVEPAVLTMNELLVASEKFEREGGESPLQGHLLALVRATADIPRVMVEAGADPVLPAQRWASAWHAVRTGQLFLAPGWWYSPLVFAAGLLLAFGPARRSTRAALMAAVFTLLVFALLALGAHGTSRVLLPLGPAMLAWVAALVLGRVGYQAGWLGK
jgi:hypothetical protein